MSVECARFRLKLMSKVKVVSVTGKADKIDLIFEYRGGKWQCKVPPQLTDGKYAVQIIARSDAGTQNSWSGYLYMLTGKPTLHLKQNKYTIKLKDKNYSINLKDKKYDLILREKSL